MSESTPEYSEVVEIIRALKKKCFPLSTFAIVVTILAVLTGGGAHTGKWFSELHPIATTAAFVLNVYSFVIEYNTVRLNWALRFVIDLKKEGVDVEQYLAVRSK